MSMAVRIKITNRFIFTIGSHRAIHAYHGENDYHFFYEVAEKIGFGHNPRYFSQLFKKYTGMTPSEYGMILSKKQ